MTRYAASRWRRPRYSASRTEWARCRSAARPTWWCGVAIRSSSPRSPSTCTCGAGRTPRARGRRNSRTGTRRSRRRIESRKPEAGSRKKAPEESLRSLRVTPAAQAMRYWTRAQSPAASPRPRARLESPRDAAGCPEPALSHSGAPDARHSRAPGRPCRRAGVHETARAGVSLRRSLRERPCLRCGARWTACPRGPCEPPRRGGDQPVAERVLRRRRRGLDWIDRDLVARLALVLELHDAIDEGKDRVVGAEADVTARVPPGAALAHDDAAGAHALAAELLDAAVLRVGVAPVARRAYALFMCHGRFRISELDVVDADFREALPVPLLLGVVLPATELEHDDLFATAVLHDLAGDLGALEGRHADLRGAAVGAEQDLVEFDLGAGVAEHRRDAQRLAWLGAELLAAGLDDGVGHGTGLRTNGLGASLT